MVVIVCFLGIETYNSLIDVTVNNESLRKVKAVKFYCDNKIINVELLNIVKSKTVTFLPRCSGRLFATLNFDNKYDKVLLEDYIPTRRKMNYLILLKKDLKVIVLKK